jgi:hypothetical protein
VKKDEQKGHHMTAASLAAMLLAAVDVSAQRIALTLDPAAGTARYESVLVVRGSGPLRVRLGEDVALDSVRTDRGTDVAVARGAADHGTRTMEVAVPDGARELRFAAHAALHDDVAAGEQAGQIHNFSVDAHVSEEGVFLSDGSAWHPQPLDGDGRPILHAIELTIAPIEGWAFVASGAPRGAAAIDAPCWSWIAPRPLEGVAVAGNRHEIHGARHDTAEGPVEIVMHVPSAHASLAPMFLDAAASYLDLYVPRLGAFPYPRFTIVENFFSSGFAMPGFTLLGPRVVAMAPRSLAPGYLDHELLHNWWGNGVYVDPEDGNWCEALTSYGANYWRRVADGGEAAGREYRRSILMRLSTDPESLDDGPLGTFGSADPSAGGAGRFVGYEKGSFVFMMLERVPGSIGAGDAIGRAAMWRAQRRFAVEHLGARAGWDDLRRAFEAELGVSLESFFQTWVREHHVPRTPESTGASAVAPFIAAFDALPSGPAVASGEDERGRWLEFDPDFACYRILPPGQIIPTLAGTLGRGGVHVVAEERSEIAALREQVEDDPAGENLLLVGDDAIARHGDLLRRASDAIVIDGAAFTVGGVRHDDPVESVLHTMAHPDRPGRFVTVFHANGDTGWSRLRLIPFYTRDTTIVWKGEEVVTRRVHEPSRRLRTE